MFFKKHQNFIISYRKYSFESSTRIWLHVPLLKILSISYKISNQKTVQLIPYKIFAHRGWRDGPRDKFLILLSLYIKVQSSRTHMTVNSQISYRESPGAQWLLSYVISVHYYCIKPRDPVSIFSLQQLKKFLKTYPEPQHRLAHISPCTCLQKNPHTWKQRCVQA